MLSVEQLEKAYGTGRRRVAAVQGVSFAVPTGAFFTLLGPSGCGKTTTLRGVAGLERIDAGRIALGGEIVSDPARGVHVPPDRRGVGMVFQSPAVWPHMTVRENVALPLVAGPRARRPSRAEAARRVEKALERVRLGGLGARPATDLSGGQQQRLALARAIVHRPRLLLLDEPLAGLDEQLRVEIREELREIQRELGVTTLYVTHDQGEALALSTGIAVVRDGTVEQIGAPEDVYARPATPFVARFVGAANLIPGTVAGRENGALVVRTVHGPLRVAQDARFPPGAGVLVVARPEHVRVDPGGAGHVVARAFLGDAVELVLRIEGEEIRARVDPLGAPIPGSPAGVRFDSGRLSLVEREHHAV